MSDDHPLQDAIDAIPKQQLELKGGVSEQDGKEVSITFEREKGNKAGGVAASISEQKGWSVTGFFRWMFGGQ